MLLRCFASGLVAWGEHRLKETETVGDNVESAQRTKQDENTFSLSSSCSHSDSKKLRLLLSNLLELLRFPTMIPEEIANVVAPSSLLSPYELYRAIASRFSLTPPYPLSSSKFQHRHYKVRTTAVWDEARVMRAMRWSDITEKCYVFSDDCRSVKRSFGVQSVPVVIRSVAPVTYGRIEWKVLINRCMHRYGQRMQVGICAHEWKGPSLSCDYPSFSCTNSIPPSSSTSLHQSASLSPLSYVEIERSPSVSSVSLHEPPTLHEDKNENLGKPPATTSATRADMEYRPQLPDDPVSPLTLQRPHEGDGNGVVDDDEVRRSSDRVVVPLNGGLSPEVDVSSLKSEDNAETKGGMADLKLLKPQKEGVQDVQRQQWNRRSPYASGGGAWYINSRQFTTGDLITITLDMVAKTVVFKRASPPRSNHRLSSSSSHSPGSIRASSVISETCSSSSWNESSLSASESLQKKIGELWKEEIIKEEPIYGTSMHVAVSIQSNGPNSGDNCVACTLIV